MSIETLRSLPYWLLKRLPLTPGLRWLAARLVNDSFLVGVCGVVRDERGRVLLFHHTYRRDPWGLPGGWMIRGESPLAAVEREVREESGLVIRAERLLRVGTAPDRARLEIVVEARFVEGVFRPSGEVSAARWCPPDDLPSLPEAQRRLLAEHLRPRPDGIGWYSVPWEDRW